MLYLLISALCICHSISAQPAQIPPNTGITCEAFTAAREAVRTYSGNHPQVMAGCQLYLDEIKALQLAGRISLDDSALILEAVAFAAEKHQYQKRKSSGQIPYIIHPIGVSLALITVGKVYDTHLLIAALLHDTVEDTQTTFQEVNARFGAIVEGYIREVTDDKSLPKEERKRLQIENAHHKSSGATLITLSDKLYNLSDLSCNPPADWSQERIDQYFLWAKSVIDQLPEVNPPLKNAVDDVIFAHLKKRSF